METIDDSALKAQHLPAQNEFWKEVWGNENALKRKLQGSDEKGFDYLDFGNHVTAVQAFCPPVPDKLCIFEEYVAALKEFKLDRNPFSTYAKGARVIGQPGIGTTCFIAYVVVERLRNKQPVAVDVTHWNNPTERYLLFTADGVTLHHCSESGPLERIPGIWALSDSHAGTLVPMPAFTDTPNIRIFQITTLTSTACQLAWVMQTGVRAYFMALPSEKEINYLSLLQNKDLARMMTLAAKWGPVPRTLIELHDDPDKEERYEAVVRRQIDRDAEHAVNPATLRRVDRETTDESTFVFFIRPLHDEDNAGEKDILIRHDHEVFVPTRWIQDEMIKGLLRRPNGEGLKYMLRGSLKADLGDSGPSMGGIF